MFRKPHRKKPVALRTSHDDDETSSVSLSTSSNKPHGNDDQDETGTLTTNELLQQIRHERENNKGKSSSSHHQQITTSSQKKNIMHQYKSSNDHLSAQEMATRTADYHPLEKVPAAAAAVNQHLPSLTSNQPRNKFLAGPLRAPNFVRTTARFDYQPDICKDYKETGFCGFGDTCIYLHDRGDTKSGWEMERDYQEMKKKEEEKRSKEVEKFMKDMMTGGIEEETDVGDGEKTLKDQVEEEDENQGNTNDGIPFACHICRGPFQNPIVTTCHHYFCELCMSTRIKSEAGGMACPICHKDTHGVLNFPQKLISKKRRLVGREGTWEEFSKRVKRRAVE